ncbi:glutamate--tRNA ligase [Helicobacter aurati]|uniref:Glutamate--tRNA ligase n=1 Tax=Helicobacter aurati TaxID=137778 RepID=A0A3D8J016_9HELI|nr:glutamate--tRNA ligase [Helicobacter aurati]RDU70869.1 glutamate--tRNA ligase [Helicobacter aurati]
MLRFAPSPTGDMHIGNLRAAIFNYLMAQKLQQPFIIRIEDTDLERNIDNKDKQILQILDCFNIKYDDIIYQSNNFPLHRELAHKLLKEGKAFYCYCSKEFLESKREEAKKNKLAFRYDDTWAQLEKGNKQTSPIIRLRANIDISFHDSIRGKLQFHSNELDSFVIMRNDIPTYNFACSIDDREMSYIIRGEDHISNTPKQILIQRALGFNTKIQYAHLPLILNEAHKKMSKRDKASSVEWLLSQDLEAQAIANYLILLGNSKLEQHIGELFTYQECLSHFSIEHISSNAARFDYKKLLQINRDVLRNSLRNERNKHSVYVKLQNALDRQLESCNKKSQLNISQNFEEMILLYAQEVSTTAELIAHCCNIFVPIATKRERLQEFHREFDTLVQLLHKQPNFTNYVDMKNYLVAESQLKGKAFFKPLRMILSGQEHGIELDKLYSVLKQHIPFILTL